MNLSQRIQALRKAGGMSQEEMADRLGVSRQAVSKWESEQSVPDLDRVVQMCELFGVTSDYLLRGIEPKNGKKYVFNPVWMFLIVSTVMNLFGVLFPCALWFDEQRASAFLPGLVFQVLGIMLYLTARIVIQGGEKQGYAAWWRVNIWLLSFLPLSAVYSALTTGVICPYPILTYPGWAYAAFWAAYLAVGLSVITVFREKQ